MTRVAFLLGAGASYPFGIPMMREFYVRFVEYLRKHRSHCIKFIETMCTEADSRLDLEILIERLEQVRAIRKGLSIINGPVGGLAETLDVADEVRGYLDMFLIETCENFKYKDVAEKLSLFTKIAQQQSAYIFTTNYDRLIELAASECSIICADGFETPSSRPESPWNGDFSNGLRLIKLHGSVNWYEEEETGNLFRLERGYSLPSHEYRISHGTRALRPLMIIPTLEKSILKQPYTGLLTQFRVL